MGGSKKKRVLNVNVGLLGHVDSGKTSLAKALSTIKSTAGFDKHPDSQERGITLDLGFSAFEHPLPPQCDSGRYDDLQFTLVDCPGHASLIRTIIGGAHIINLMVLVIDVVRGIQTQTAECIVIGELMTDKFLIVLNKVDLLPEDKREEKVEKMKRKLTKVFEKTRLSGAPIVAVSANPGAKGDGGAIGIDTAVEHLTSMVQEPSSEDLSRPFYFAIDHCFPIKGQGTVVTGTVLDGQVSVNDEIEFPDLKLQRKVKSMQMFRKPIETLRKGDRAGICVTQLDAAAIERGIAAAPGSVPTFDAAICRLEKIRFHKQSVSTNQKLHITVGHTTVMGKVTFFRDLDFNCELDLISRTVVRPAAAGGGTRGEGEGGGGDGDAGGAGVGGMPEFDWDREYPYADELVATDKEHLRGSQMALIEFDSAVTCPLTSALIGSRLDADVHTKDCRLAFYGAIVSKFTPDTDRPRLKLFKLKRKECFVDRVNDERTVIGNRLVGKDGDVTAFLGLKVRTAGGKEGRIDSSFGKSGKFKVVFSDDHDLKPHDKMVLEFKRLVLEKDRTMRQ